MGKYLTKNPDSKDLFLDLLNYTSTFGNKEDHFGIKDIVVESHTEEHIFPSDESDESIEEPNWTQTVYDVYTRYPRFTLPLKAESSGTLNLMKMLIAFCRVMNNEKILLCDEPETSFHSNLFREIIRMFLDPKYNTNAQMLCATHATDILDLNLLRRDQLYFASMDTSLESDRTTALKRLSDIGNIRTTDNVRKDFLKGNYVEKHKVKL